jgi:hypothetical protein
MISRQDPLNSKENSERIGEKNRRAHNPHHSVWRCRREAAVDDELSLAHPWRYASEPPRRRLAGIEEAAEFLARGCPARAESVRMGGADVRR